VRLRVLELPRLRLRYKPRRARLYGSFALLAALALNSTRLLARSFARAIRPASHPPDRIVLVFHPGKGRVDGAPASWLVATPTTSAPQWRPFDATELHRLH